MKRRSSLTALVTIGFALLFALLTTLPSSAAHAASLAQIPPRPTLTPQAPAPEPTVPAPAPAGTPKREAPAAPTPTPWPMRGFVLQPIDGVLPAQNETVRYQYSIAPQDNAANDRAATAMPSAQIGATSLLTALVQNRTLLLSLLALDVIAMTVVIRRRFFAH